MYDNVFDAADKVETFQNFIDFLLILESSYRDHGTAWENQTIDRMMEAASAWATDAAKREPELKTPSWQNFAQILSAGLIYE
jgi:hypothetical protein